MTTEPTGKQAGKPLTIAVIGTRGFPGVQGGVETHCMELYTRIAAMGHHVTVFTRTPYIPAQQRRSEYEDVRLIHVWCPRLKSMEAIVHSFRSLWKAWRIKPDILHIHAVGPALIMPFARLLGLRPVMTHHGPDYKRAKWGKVAKIVLKLGERLGVGFAWRIITIGPEIAGHIQKLYGRTPVIIPNGVTIPEPLPPGETLEKWDLAPGNYVFTACRFVPEKGLTDLIRAYGMMKNPGFKLVIAGDADHETEYSRDVKTMAAETPGVVLTGFISGQPLTELFSSAGLFVLPSYYEGLPISLLEALSYGLPVLAGDIPACRQVELPAHRFIPPGDIPGWSAGLKTAMDEGITHEEKDVQLNMIRTKYSWDRIAYETVEVYFS